MKFKRLITIVLLSVGIIVGGVAVSQTSTVTASAKTTWIKGFPKVLHNTKWKSHLIHARIGGNFYEEISFWNSETSGFQAPSAGEKYDTDAYLNHSYYHHTAGSAYYYLKGSSFAEGYASDADNGHSLNLLDVEYYRVTVGKNKIKITPKIAYGYLSDPKDPSAHYPTQKFVGDEMTMLRTVWMYRK